MGVDIRGNTAPPPNNTHFWNNGNLDTALCGTDSYYTGTDDLYVDSIHVYCGAYSGSSNATYWVVHTADYTIQDGHTFAGPAVGAGYGWNGTPNYFSNLIHLPPFTFYTAAVLLTGGGGAQTAGRQDGGNFLVNGVSTPPSPFGGTQINGQGALPWYLTVYYATTLTSVPTSGGPYLPGQTFAITGSNFANNRIGGVNFLGSGGTPVPASTFTVDSNTQITVTVPYYATTGPVQVLSLAGNPTSAGSVPLGMGAWVKAGGVLQRAKGVWVKQGGVLQPAKGIWTKQGGSLQAAK